MNSVNLTVAVKNKISKYINKIDSTRLFQTAISYLTPQSQRLRQLLLSVS